MEKIVSREWTKVEIILAFTTILFGGILIGILLSPKGNRIYGSYNGSTNMVNPDAEE